MQEDLLRLENIGKEYDKNRVLKDVSFSLKKGEILGLVGENGAGKSTLMKCLYGIYYRDNGSIKVEGQEVNFMSSKDALDHGVAMIHQELQPIPEMTIAENMFLEDYPNSNRKGEMLEEYEYKISAYLKGLPNTPLGEAKSGKLKKEVFTSYKAAVETETYFSDIVEEHLKNIEENSNIIDESVQRRAYELVNKAVENFR